MKILTHNSLTNGPVDLTLCCVDNFEARMTVNRVGIIILIYFKNFSIKIIPPRLAMNWILFGLSRVWVKMLYPDISSL